MKSLKDLLSEMRPTSPVVIVNTRRVASFVWTHPANEGQRGRALVRAARFQVRGRVLRRPSLAKLGDKSCLLAHLHRAGASKVIYGNPPDYPEMMLWRRTLRRGDTFLDIGANVGSYAIWAAELGADVIAVEPADDTFVLLQENIKLNGYPIEVVHAAAGAICGVAKFTSGQDCVNRMDPHGSIDTKVVTVDSLIGNRTVAGMKVDVEGFEIDVLRGCSRALAEHRIRLIQLEWNSASEAAVGTDRLPVADLLSRYGYALRRPDADGALWPVDNYDYGPDVFAVWPDEYG